MREIRELVGTRDEFTDHLAKMRDGLLADAKTAGKPVDKQRLHGRAEGVELVLRELAVWTQTDAIVTDDTPGPMHAQDRPGPPGTD